MKLYKKIIAGLLTVSLLACINWNYLGNLWGLTWDAAMGLVSGETVSTTALQSELDSLSLGKLLKFNIDGFSPDDNVTTEAMALDDTTEEFDADTTEDKSGLKSGKDLIKNISKIEYGTDELSQVAIEFRKANNITSARRNICVVEYKNADGTIVQKAFASNASNHSEELMIDFLKADNISGEDVIKIFTEREPCVETATNVGHNCTNRIIEYTPDAEVTYAVDYGVTQEDGLNARNILQELLQTLLN